MRPLLVDLGQDVEDEGLHVKVQGLVVQEEFGQQTQVLAVDLHTDQRSHLQPRFSFSFFNHLENIRQFPPCDPGRPLRTPRCCSSCRSPCRAAASTDSETEKMIGMSGCARPFLIGRRWACSTDQVMSEGLLVLHVLEAVLADPQLGLFPIILWKGREVPGVDLKVSNLDLVHVLDFSDLEVAVERRGRCLSANYHRFRQ